MSARRPLRQPAGAATVEAMIRTAIALLALGLLALVGAAASSGAPANGARTGTDARKATAGAGEGQVTTARKRRRHRRHRSGCGKYCRQAGGFGGGPDDPPPVVRIPSQKLRVDRFGQIGVRATCARDRKCVGAILVDSSNASYGRANLVIRAHKTRRVWVDVPRKARRYLKRHGRDKGAYATVPLKGDAPLSISEPLTLLPPR
jgi:hypothetical protein